MMFRVKWQHGPLEKSARFETEAEAAQCARLLAQLGFPLLAVILAGQLLVAHDLARWVASVGASLAGGSSASGSPSLRCSPEQAEPCPVGTDKTLLARVAAR